MISRRERVNRQPSASIAASDAVGALALADWLGPAAAVALIAAEGLVALGLVALVWPELRRPVDLLAGAPQPAAGATSSRTAIPSNSGEGAG